VPTLTLLFGLRVVSIVGSIANITVVDQAVALGVRIGWREPAWVGVPVRVATLLVAAAWLALR
jgi:hypothetical protein